MVVFRRNVVFFHSERGILHSDFSLNIVLLFKPRVCSLGSSAKPETIVFLPTGKPLAITTSASILSPLGSIDEGREAGEEAGCQGPHFWLHCRSACVFQCSVSTTFGTFVCITSVCPRKSEHHSDLKPRCVMCWCFVFFKLRNFNVMRVR